MISFLAILSLLTTFSKGEAVEITNCFFGKNELNIALNALHSKSILELETNKLSLNARDVKGLETMDLNKDAWMVGNKAILLVEEAQGTPWVVFSTRESSGNDESNIKINFSAGEGGKTFKGVITFECLNDGLFFKDIHYFSAIN